MNRKWRLVYVIISLLIVLGCALPVWTPTPTPMPTATLWPTFTPMPTLPPTLTPVPEDTGWLIIVPGIEQRSLNVKLGETLERVTVIRLRPDLLRVQVFYTPGQAQLVSDWARQTGATFVVNAGYFTPEYTVAGLLISDAERYGVSYADYAGMFAVDEAGMVSLRWLRAWPYDPGEILQQAIQCFPVLVKPGGIMGFPADADDGRPARRTVVAQDRAGNIMFLIAPRGYFSLHNLAVWLVESDLDVDIALNLDGGPSSGVWVEHGPQIDSLGGVPAVIGVYTKRE